MPMVLARLNEADYPQESMGEIKNKISLELVQEMREKFGLVGAFEEIRDELAKVLWRYQSNARNMLAPKPAPQSKEFDRLEKAISRVLAAFENISEVNKSLIDDEIMYRDPFSRKFYFKEQLDYWANNEYSTQIASNKLTQISHAIGTLKNKRKSDATFSKATTNTPLDHLIQDLSMDFERGTERKAKAQCYYDPKNESYAGQYYDFIEFILIRFAPKSYHSQVALGKRIVRVLSRLEP